MAAKLVFGRVPIPEHLILRDIVSDGPNTAYDYLGPRGDIGTCTHRMVGTLLGTDGFFEGEARERSLTDFGIGGPWDGELDGTIYQWVPADADVAPWANGPANDLEGDGIAFVQQLGIAAVNRDLRSIELSDGGDITNPYGPDATPKQFAAHVALVARIFDRAEVPWDQFPFNPAVGVVTYLEHWEFGPKECPFQPVRKMVNQSQAAIRGLMKLHQTGIGTKPEPQPAEPPVTIPYSAGMDQDFLRGRWGRPRRIYADGRAAIDKLTGDTKTYPWNPKWLPCSAWIARARIEKAFPAPRDWTTFVSKEPNSPTSLITFENGWILGHFEHRGWQWIEAAETRA
jgi:hypothetical protein